MAEWISFLVDGIVDEAPQIVLLLVAFAFLVAVLMGLVYVFEYIYQRLTNNVLLDGLFSRDLAALDQLFDQIERLRDDGARDEEPIDAEDAETIEADREYKITRLRVAWNGRRMHLLRKQQTLRAAVCVSVALLLFWRVGALDSRWCSLSTTHRQLVYSLLAHTTSILNAQGIQYWVDGPTLLSVTRDHKLSEWDDRIVLGAFKESKAALWGQLRPALEQRGRYYLEKYHASVLPLDNPPVFRLHYASLQRHYSRLPYLDIYLYDRETSDVPAKEDSLPRVKESAVLPLRNVTLESESRLTYSVSVPNEPGVFLGRETNAGTPSVVQRPPDDGSGGWGPSYEERGYKAFTCYLYRDEGHNLGTIALAATLIYFALVVYVLPRVSFNERWRF